MPTIQQILDSLKSRSGRKGVVTADHYFRSIEGCFDGGFCPSKVFKDATPEQWAQHLKKAESGFTFTDKRLRFDVRSIKAASEVTDMASLLNDAKLAAKALAVVDGVVTTTKRDRDGDILETKGAIVDEAMPFLWQHIPIAPIGKMFKILKHTDKILICRFVIAGTDLGEDALKLIELGALRISHGFIPKDGEFEPLEDEQGWHFKGFEIYEASGVSVPSNTDATFTAYSRNQLKSAVVRASVKKEFDARSPQGIGFDLKSAQQAAALTINEIRKVLDLPEGKPACTCGSKDHKPAVATVEKSLTKQAFGDVTGSYEDLRGKLQDDIARFFAASGDALDRSDWAYIHSTFPDYCIVCVCEDYDEQEYYRIAWKLVEGKPTLVGEAIEVVLTLTAEAKARHALLHKKPRHKGLPSIVGGPIPASEVTGPSTEGEGPVGQMTCPECGYVGDTGDFMDAFEMPKSFTLKELCEKVAALAFLASPTDVPSIKSLNLQLSGVLDQAAARQKSKDEQEKNQAMQKDLEPCFQ